MSILSAYEKMLEDGTANVPIKIGQPTPSNPKGSTFGGHKDEISVAQGQGLGEKVVKEEVETEVDPHGDYSHFDSQMEEYIKNRRAAKGGGNNKPTASSNEIKEIRKRLDMIEKTMGLIMETHKLLLEKNA